ncbi:MAG: ornithine carbamoyltransferase, partial [Nitriliruptor sp.]
MPTDLRQRNFLKELDLTPDEWRSLLDLAAELKADKAAGRERQRLTGRNIALIFEKTSTRTRCAFEVAAFDQGAHVSYLEPTGTQIGHKESMKDTARVLGRFYDGIQYRGSTQRNVEILGEFAGVPVWNGLTDEWHPTQTLCDTLTMREHSGRPLEEVTLAYLGDARNNVGNSLLIAGAMVGMAVRMIAPRELWNEPEVIEQARAIAKATGARITHTDDVAGGVEGADFLYTDVWVSMGEPAEVWDERIASLQP